MGTTLKHLPKAKIKRLNPNTWVKVSRIGHDEEAMLLVEKYSPDHRNMVTLYSPNSRAIYSVDYREIVSVIGYLEVPRITKISWP